MLQDSTGRWIILVYFSQIIIVIEIAAARALDRGAEPIYIMDIFGKSTRDQISHLLLDFSQLAALVLG